VSVTSELAAGMCMACGTLSSKAMIERGGNAGNFMMSRRRVMSEQYTLPLNALARVRGGRCNATLNYIVNALEYLIPVT
jgi:hypothetical protein